jgi:glutamate-ammonia-ligase adenylyltransferase
MFAAEQYYESMGQNWERAAMIKARAMAGDIAAGERFLDHLSPFIWRRNLDFASIEDVHSIKQQIHGHRGHSQIAIAGHNIKLGRGGIRDIEFFVQTQQLIAGGRDPSIRHSTTYGGLQALADGDWLDHGVVTELRQAYEFHRTLEHRLQMVADEQTQTMPKTAEGVAHIACFMGYRETAEFESRLLYELKTVQGHYANLFETAPELSRDGNLVFTGTDDDPETLETLQNMGFADPAQVSRTVRGWHHGRYRATRTQRSREQLTKLMPTLLAIIAESPGADATLARFDRFLGGLPTGVQLFAMLTAVPQLLSLLVEILGSAPRLANYLSRQPGVLDAVLDEDFFATLPPNEELSASLYGGLRLAADLEEALNVTRRWVKDRRFQLGVQCLRGTADIDTQGLEQSQLAETALAGLLDKVSEDFAVRERHGRIPDAGMVIVGMGKLGSNEMSETSDLDLIFIYDFPEDTGQSDGARPLAASHYFTRLSQRLITAITAPTAEGALYEVDMRLRPSGKAGPLATRIDGFISYQQNEAWTWEHMALTRARTIAGPEALRERIEAAIRDVLTQPRDAGKTAVDVADMRERIAKEKGSDDPWELKMVRGGLLDIEFIAQYLQLIHGADHPDALNPNTCTALAHLAADGAIEAPLAEELIAASTLYRGVMGVLRVAVEGAFDPATAPPGLQAAMVHACDGEVSFDGIEDLLKDRQARISALYDRVVAEAARAAGD